MTTDMKMDVDCLTELSTLKLIEESPADLQKDHVIDACGTLDSKDSTSKGFMLPVAFPSPPRRLSPGPDNYGPLWVPTNFTIPEHLIWKPGTADATQRVSIEGEDAGGIESHMLRNHWGDMDELEDFELDDWNPSDDEGVANYVDDACKLLTFAMADNEDSAEHRVKFDILMEFLGFSPGMYREHQLEAMMAAQQGHNLVLHMHTGAGKSLCYMLPALLPFDSNGSKYAPLTVVITPMIALIQDQVEKLAAKNVKAITIYGEQPVEERSLVERENIYSARLLYITPEMLQQSERLEGALNDHHEAGQLVRFVIDEAHCIVEHGDFRQAYRDLLEFLQKRWPTVPLTLCSATFTPRTLQEALKPCGLKEVYLFKGSLERPNLYWEVRDKGKGWLEELVQFVSKELEKGHCGIVYSFSRSSCEAIAKKLRKEEIAAEHFHGGVKREEKRRIQAAWHEGTVRVVVATTAFGMGVDKPDVRFVIHATMPQSVESLYQEAGRAGRDGKDAICRMYYAFEDGHNWDRDEHNPNAWPEGVKNVQVYAEDVTTCRRVTILKHLGQDFDATKCMGKCDNCSRGDTVDGETVDATHHAREIVELFKKASLAKKEVTLRQLSDFYTGGQQLKNLGKELVKRLAHAVKGKGLGSNYVEAILRRLLSVGVLRRTRVTAWPRLAAYLATGINEASLLEGELRIFVHERLRAESVPRPRKRKARNSIPAPTAKKPKVGVKPTSRNVDAGEVLVSDDDGDDDDDPMEEDEVGIEDDQDVDPEPETVRQDDDEDEVVDEQDSDIEGEEDYDKDGQSFSGSGEEQVMSHDDYIP